MPGQGEEGGEKLIGRRDLLGISLRIGKNPLLLFRCRDFYGAVMSPPLRCSLNQEVGSQPWPTGDGVNNPDLFLAVFLRDVDRKVA